jgi:hypothetical protein
MVRALYLLGHGRWYEAGKMNGKKNVNCTYTKKLCRSFHIARTQTLNTQRQKYHLIHRQ